MKFKTLLFCLVLSACVNTDTAYQKTEKNYGREIDALAKKFDLPAEYLKALIILESSGEKNIKPRFEAHVYRSLIKVREGKRMRYENITRSDLKNASNEAIRNLARSWGPFQIMGYKCIKLKINVNDLRSQEALYWGMVWIKHNYGDYLRKKKFKEAFRIHNTGSPTGRTFHSNYVKNGLKHIEYFQNNGS